MTSTRVSIRLDDARPVGLRDTIRFSDAGTDRGPRPDVHLRTPSSRDRAPRSGLACVRAELIGPTETVVAYATLLGDDVVFPRGEDRVASLRAAAATLRARVRALPTD